jgi:hypothetical protein
MSKLLIIKILLSIGSLGATAGVSAAFTTSVVETRHEAEQTAPYAKWKAKGNAGSEEAFLGWVEEALKDNNNDGLDDEIALPAEAKEVGYETWLEARLGDGSEDEFLSWVETHLNQTNDNSAVNADPNVIIRTEEKIVDRPVEVVVEKPVEVIVERPVEKIVEKIVETDKAHELWLAEGNQGTDEDFIAWIKDMTLRQYEDGSTDDTSIFSDVAFSSEVTEYDGTEHVLEVTGVPAGTEIHYSDNKASDVGSYRGFVFLHKKGVESKVMTAELTITKINITSAVFDDQTVTYDGSTKNIMVTGAPGNVNIEYTMNGQPFTGATEAGSYEVTVTLTGDNYNTYTDTAILTIAKADIKSVAFNDSEVTYDGKSHNILISGNRPNGVGLEYIMSDAPFTGATNAGVYTIQAKMTGGSNYNDLTLTAVLVIKKADINGISFNSYSTTYGSAKYIEVLGALPDGVSVAYTHKDSGSPFEGVTELGDHTVLATLTGDNYNTTVFEATITIRPEQLAQPTGLSLTVEKNSAGKTRGVHLTWDAVPNAASYNINVYSKSSGELVRIIYPDTSTESLCDTTKLTCDIRRTFGYTYAAGEYIVRVVAIPEEGSTSYAQSEPSEEAKEYAHAGQLATPNVRYNSGTRQFSWDAVRSYDDDFKYTIYDVRVYSYDKEGNLLRTWMSDNAYTTTSVTLDEIKADAGITTGRFRFQFRAVANASLTAFAANGSTNSEYSEYTELFVFE